MAITKPFATNIFPLSSARGFAVAALTGIGLLMAILYSQTSGIYRELTVLLSFFSLLTSACLHFSYQNFAVDEIGYRYRYFHSFFGFHIGTWYILPNVTGVVLKHFSERPAANRRQWQIANFIPYCIVMLSIGAADHHGIIVYKFPHSKKSQAVKLTQDLAAYFGVPALNYDAHE